MEIVATRMNLLLKREEIETASSGAELLRNKRDVLLNEFFLTLRSLMTLRESLDHQGDEALVSLIFALGREGREKLISSSFGRRTATDFEIHYRNLWGVAIPEIDIESLGQGERGRVPGLEIAFIIEETREKFQGFLNLALKVLPEELKLKRLGQEIKGTTRKVNALEKYVIPHLYTQVKYIRESLEEREREDIFRLKRLKKRNKA